MLQAAEREASEYTLHSGYRGILFSCPKSKTRIREAQANWTFGLENAHRKNFQRAARERTEEEKATTGGLAASGEQASQPASQPASHSLISVRRAERNDDERGAGGERRGSEREKGTCEEPATYSACQRESKEAKME